MALVPRKRNSALLVTLGIYVVFVFYPVVRLASWLPILDVYALIFIAFLQAIPYFLLAGWFVLRSRIRLARSKVLLTWTGISYMLFPVVLCLEIVNLAFDIPSSLFAVIGIGSSMLVTLYALYNAHRFVVRKVKVQVPTALRGQTLVQVSDVHIGSRKPKYLRRVVKKVKQLEADYFVITGDLVDSSTITQQDLAPLEEIQSPKFFTIGNHERYEDCEAIVAWMRGLGFQVLRDESVVHDHIQFLGIDDTDSAQVFQHKFDQLTLVDDLYHILFYHRPSEYEYVAKRGINLMITGHTHHGQVFPFNFLVKRIFKYTKGTHTIDTMTLHVSTGTGTWGPILRFGSNNEITQFCFV